MPFGDAEGETLQGAPSPQPPKLRGSPTVGWGPHVLSLTPQAGGGDSLCSRAKLAE